MNDKCKKLYMAMSDTKLPKDNSLKFDSYVLPNSDYIQLEEEKHARLLKTDNPLILPVGTKLKFILKSSDVIHN
jgi:heme/copper-type cytochrome/quinol oxidase subunit 2